jgi:cell division septum initiation protein DivIVA
VVVGGDVKATSVAGANQPRRMMTTELMPQFATTLRGYDRIQVDSYVETLREWLETATARMEAAQAESLQLHQHVAWLRQRVAEFEAQSSHEPPRSVSALGDRVARILGLAEESAEAVRASAETTATEVVSKAHEEAAELSRASQLRQAEAEAMLAEATRQTEETVHRAEELAAQAAARVAERLDDQIRTLEAQRDGVLATLASLRESLQRAIGQLPADPQAEVPAAAGPAGRNGAPARGSARRTDATVTDGPMTSGTVTDGTVTDGTVTNGTVTNGTVPTGASMDPTATAATSPESPSTELPWPKPPRPAGAPDQQGAG